MVRRLVTADDHAADVPSIQRRTYSVPEAAAILGISRAQAYNCVRSGELPALRFGRRLVIPAVALDRLLGTAVVEEAT